MPMKCILSCESMNQRVELNLTANLMDMSTVDFSKCQTVYEDGSYNITFLCDDYSKSDVSTISACVNGEQIGKVVLSPDPNLIKGVVNFNDDNWAKQPFLLHYDLVTISFVVSFSDSTSKEFFSDFLLCISKQPEDAANIQRIVQELIAFNDSQVGEWIFFNPNHSSSSSLYAGKWNKHAYKSLSSYIQLVEQVVTCYRNNYAYFKTQGKHTIAQSEVLVPCEKVKQVTRNSFQWVMQNADQLAHISHSSGIQYQRKNYLPYRIKTITNEKSWDVYENRIVINFLYTSLQNAQQVFSEFDKDILDEERIISRIHGRFPKEYCAPIITIKTLQASFCRTLLEKLRHSIDALQYLYNQYRSLFDVQPSILNILPRKTSTFCEIKPYALVFEIIVRWFQYGEYSLEKERLILQVKTLDKLFEYYCLLQLLKLLADNGYQMANIKTPVFKFDYTAADEYYQNEKDVANTYILSNGSITATLYYQPVISAVRFENNLALYRTTSSAGRANYYTPDFVLKFTSSNGDEEYVIFDAKFSSRSNIIKHSLPNIIYKYSCETSVSAPVCAPRMVWALQGRVNSSDRSIWRFHTSPLATEYRPSTSYGIISMNTTVEISQRLWNEIRNNISFLH